MFDSTPDLAHREQMSEVVRYVDVDYVSKKVAIKESFLGFIEIHGKDAVTIEEVIVNKLETDKMPLQIVDHNVMTMHLLCPSIWCSRKNCVQEQ